MLRARLTTTTAAAAATAATLLRLRLRLALRLRLRRIRTDDAERLESDLCRVLLGVVVVVAAVPVASLELLAVDGDGAGVSCASAWRNRGWAC